MTFYNNNHPMERKNKIQLLAERISKGFGRIVRRNLQTVFSRVKMISIAKQVKSMKSCLEPSSVQEPMISSRRSTMYDTIRPLENNYSSIKIINNSGFDKGAENNTVKILDELDSELLYQKKDFIEKYMNQTKKPILMIEEFPKSIYTTKNISQYNPHALKNIKQADYNEFFEQVLAKKTFFGKPINRMEYKPTPIRSALTCVEQQYDQVAVSIFQKILKFQNPACSRNKFSYAADIVNYCMKKGEQLIIELYMQILKQLNGPKFKTYLQLLCVVCATIKVPFRMYTPLLNYFLTNLEKAKTQFTYMFFLLIRNFDKPRKQGITEFQAQCVMFMLQIPVTMDMPTEKTFFMETTATVEDLVQCIVSFFELDSSVNYLLYFQENYYHTGKLFDCFYISVFNVGDQIPLSSQQVYKKFHGYKVVLTFKNMMDSLKSKAGKDLLYIFESKKYLEGAFNLTREEMMLMAAYKYYSENDVLDVIDLCLYIPSIVIKAYGERNVRKQIVKNFKAIKCTKNEARKNFLKIISDKDIFMALTFYSSLYFDDDDEITIDIVLFLRPGYITLFGYNDYPLYKMYEFESIKQWGKTQSQICFKVSEMGSIHIECSNQALVNEVFEDYLKSLEEYVIEEKKEKLKQKNTKKRSIHKRSYESDSTRPS